MIVLYICLAVLALFWYFYSNKKSNLKGKPIPGPKGWPFIGMGLEVSSETMFLKLSEYAKQYGDIVQLKVFGETLVCLNKMELVRKAFNEDPYRKVMNDRVNTFWATRILIQSGSVGFYPKAFDGIHGNLRKGMIKALHVYGDGIKKFEDLITSELYRFHKVLDKKQGQDIVLSDVLKRSLTNVISVLLSGQPIDDNDPDVGLFWQLDYTNEYMLNPTTNTILNTFPFIVHLPGYNRTMYNDSVDAKGRILKRYFYKMRETYKRGEIRGLVDTLLEEQTRQLETGEELLWTDERVQSNILETIAAGIVTTLTTVTNTMLFLLHHPEYQDRIYEELTRVIGHDRMPSLDDRGECPLLEAVILEGLRFIPPVPLLLPHLVNKDIEFEGYHVPKGSQIIPNVWQIQHDEAVWGDPWKFRPERWLDESGQAIPPSHPLRKQWLVFGTGRRMCNGEQFGRNRNFLYMASLLKEYKFTGTPGKFGSYDARHGKFVGTLILRSAPYQCKIERRQHSE